MKETSENSTIFILGQLSAKMDAMDKKLDNVQALNLRTLDDHEKRLRSLERMLWRMSAVSGAVGGIGAIIAQYGATFLYHYLNIK